VSFFLVHSPPGASVALHSHPYPEVFILQAGRATFEVDEIEITAVAGDIVIAPAGAPHQFANTGGEELRLTAIRPASEMSMGASMQSLEWTVNAYTLTFAVLLLTGAALGDRLGRRRMFAVGLTIFTAASAGAAVSASTDALIAARAVQGLGAAIVLPLTLTLLSEAVPPARRGMALGIWGGVSGLGVAIGPLVGGVVISGISWHWIFWINVPVGLVLVPPALTRLTESHGPSARRTSGAWRLRDRACWASPTR
jgi:MFS family permease